MGVLTFYNCFAIFFIDSPFVPLSWATIYSIISWNFISFFELSPTTVIIIILLVHIIVTILFHLIVFSILVHIIIVTILVPIIVTILVNIAVVLSSPTLSQLPSSSIFPQLFRHLLSLCPVLLASWATVYHVLIWNFT